MATKKKSSSKRRSKSTNSVKTKQKKQSSDELKALLNIFHSKFAQIKKDNPKIAKYESEAQEYLGKTEEFIREHPILSVILSFWLGKKVGKWFK